MMFYAVILENGKGSQKLSQTKLYHVVNDLPYFTTFMDMCSIKHLYQSYGLLLEVRALLHK